MQVFLSWSGERSSAVAQLLSEWLPQVIQAAEPFISTGIEKGRRWSGEIADRLSSAPVGVICVTRENLRSPWLLFEAGAISKPREGYVCTFLLDVEPADVEPPLGDFQHTRALKPDVYRLVQTINGALGLKGEKPLSEGVLERVFERNWPELDLRLQNISDSREKQPERARPDRDILEEILALVRRPNPVADFSVDAAYGERLASIPVALEALYSRPNMAFIYTVQLVDAGREQTAQTIAAIEKIEGFVTCGSRGDHIECVFLRPAESDVANTVKALGNFEKISSARSTTFDRGGHRLPDDSLLVEAKNLASKPRRRRSTLPPRKA